MIKKSSETFVIFVWNSGLCGFSYGDVSKERMTSAHLASHFQAGDMKAHPNQLFPPYRPGLYAVQVFFVMPMVVAGG